MLQRRGPRDPDPLALRISHPGRNAYLFSNSRPPFLRLLGSAPETANWLEPASFYAHRLYAFLENGCERDHLPSIREPVSALLNRPGDSGAGPGKHTVQLVLDHAPLICVQAGHAVYSGYLSVAGGFIELALSVTAGEAEVISTFPALAASELLVIRTPCRYGAWR